MADKRMKMNPVVHFEMPAEDRKRMAVFYTNVPSKVIILTDIVDKIHSFEYI